MAEIILGISAFFHDSAAVLVVDGKLIAAAQEERFSRIKNDAAFPINAIKYVLEEAEIEYESLTAIAFYEKPLLKFERLLETYHAFAPYGLTSFLKAMPIWLKDKLFFRKAIAKGLKPLGNKKIPLYFPEHHLSHAASAFFPSPFEEATIITIDGVGEWATLTIAHGKGNDITILQEQHFPHSLGLLYSAVTYYLGFEVNNGEYKVMGLAAYGEKDSPQVRSFVEKIKEEVVDIRADGSFLLNMEYFKYATALEMTHDVKWQKLIGLTRRRREENLDQAHADLALAIQLICEEIVFRLAETAIKSTQCRNVVMAGGVALNSVANGKLSHLNTVENLWIQPAAGDAGGALGAALATYYIAKEKARTPQYPDAMYGALLGPSFTDAHIANVAENYPELHKSYFQTDDALVQATTDYLIEGKVVGWFQGRMEFGPRALGNRSILGDPRNTEMQQTINKKIKFRESFRPFAPSILEEDAQEYFNIQTTSSYMQLVRPVLNAKRKKVENKISSDFLFQVKQIRSTIPAVTHVDFSARIQTVDRFTNPLYRKLLEVFKEKTGIGILINTSFNIKDEPIVCTPKNAFEGFLKTEMDILVIGKWIFTKKP